MEDPTAAQAQRKRLKLPLAPANLLENVSSTAMHSRNADVSQHQRKHSLRGEGWLTQA